MGRLAICCGTAFTLEERFGGEFELLFDEWERLDGGLFAIIISGSVLMLCFFFEL